MRVTPIHVCQTREYDGLDLMLTCDNPAVVRWQAPGGKWYWLCLHHHGVFEKDPDGGMELA